MNADEREYFEPELLAFICVHLRLLLLPRYGKILPRPSSHCGSSRRFTAFIASI